MKKIILGLLCFSSFSYAQTGLQRIIVEKYYVSNAADAAQADIESNVAGYPTGTLPVGSVTYRIYADMMPGYKLMQLYADTVYEHGLRISTTTSFYNNPSGGTTAGSTKSAIKNNLLALDSWFSMGGVATGQYGIPKSDDNGVANNVTTAGNTDVVLLNDVPATMGIPLTSQDGMIAGTGIQAPSFSSFTNEADIFGDGSITGKSLYLYDGSVYCSGAVGPVPDSNKVLIAQLTTDGKLSFKLNVLVQKIGVPGGKFYVASDPKKTVLAVDTEGTIPSLTYPEVPTSVHNLTPAGSQSATLFNVYPNPATDMLTLEINDTRPDVSNAYTIYGVLGNRIIRKNLGAISGRHIESIDISALEKGIYFIEVSTDGITSTKRIIKD